LLNSARWVLPLESEEEIAEKASTIQGDVFPNRPTCGHLLERDVQFIERIVAGPHRRRGGL